LFFSGLTQSPIFFPLSVTIQINRQRFWLIKLFNLIECIFFLPKIYSKKNYQVLVHLAILFVII
jgi:hypothetical protein